MLETVKFNAEARQSLGLPDVALAPGLDALQRAMEPTLVAAVERLTGRTVHTFLSGTSTAAESSSELFVLEPLPPGE